jgi:predicted MFS family arabinose efflux permease
LPQYLAICGVSPATSASALGLIGLGNAAGSFIIGRLGARFSQKRLLSLIYLLRTATIVVFLSVPVTPASTLAFAAAMGLLWLGVVPLVSGLIGALFGMRYFNTLFGLTFFSHQTGAFGGAWIGGLIFDLTGNFNAAWTAMILIGLTAAALQWFMDESPNSRSATLRERAV